MLRTRNVCIGIAGVALAAGLATIVSGGSGVNAESGSNSLAAEATIMNGAQEVIGFAKFTEDGGGVVHVNIKVSGISAGKHGVHIHETGSCASGASLFSLAGGHYSPADPAHPNHRGDLPNLIVNDDLQGRLNTTTQRVTLSDGPTTVFDLEAGKLGSAIVIHANEDLFGNTTVANGNSGPRIACGVIERK